MADVTTLDPRDIKASQTLLFVELEDLPTIERALKPYKIVIPRRKTPYGSDEIGYREPSGHFVLFAQFPDGLSTLRNKHALERYGTTPRWNVRAHRALAEQVSLPPL